MLLSCNSKKEEPSIAKVIGVELRSGDYRKSYFFDQNLGDVTKKVEHWNRMLNHLVDAQSTTEKQPALVNSIELALPLFKEAQRGFFKRALKGWRKEVTKTERLSQEKEIFLEKMTIDLLDGANLSERESSWTLVATGKYGKDQSGELFVVQWIAEKNELVISSKINADKPFLCTFNLKTAGLLEKVNCENFMIFRIENKDITIEHLTYDLKKGFNGEGKVKNSKGQIEKWEIHSAQPTLLPTPIGSDQ